MPINIQNVGSIPLIESGFFQGGKGRRAAGNDALEAQERNQRRALLAQQTGQLTGMIGQFGLQSQAFNNQLLRDDVIVKANMASKEQAFQNKVKFNKITNRQAIEMLGEIQAADYALGVQKQTDMTLGQLEGLGNKMGIPFNEAVAMATARKTRLAEDARLKSEGWVKEVPAANIQAIKRNEADLATLRESVLVGDMTAEQAQPEIARIVQSNKQLARPDWVFKGNPKPVTSNFREYMANDGRMDYYDPATGYWASGDSSGRIAPAGKQNQFDLSTPEGRKNVEDTSIFVGKISESGGVDVEVDLGAVKLKGSRQDDKKGASAGKDLIGVPGTPITQQEWERADKKVRQLIAQEAINEEKTFIREPTPTEIEAMIDADRSAYYVANLSRRPVFSEIDPIDRDLASAKRLGFSFPPETTTQPAPDPRQMSSDQKMAELRRRAANGEPKAIQLLKMILAAQGGN